MTAPSSPFRRTIAFVLAVACLLGLTGAASGRTPTGRVALVFAIGGLGDQSFNDSAYEGIREAADKLGITYDYAEPAAIADYETLLTQFAQRRYDLIIGIGYYQADAVERVAARFPSQRFALIDAAASGDNVASYTYREAERGFLVGAIAGLMTQRDDDPLIDPKRQLVGIVAGMDVPLINANIAGFMAGARLVNPGVTVIHTYVGDWTDPVRGKELALTQFDRGVDVIWAVAGRSGLGVIQAAQERNRYVIGADSDQTYLAPHHVLTNGIKHVNDTVLLAVESVLNGTFQPGVHSLGVAEGVLGYTAQRVPAGVRDAVDALATRIAAGELAPPSDIPQVDSWLTAHGHVRR